MYQDSNYNGNAAKMRKAEDAALRSAYGRVFAGESGRRVLEDLMQRYGFYESGVEKTSVVPGDSPESVFLRDGMKEPIRHILYMSGARFFNQQQEQPTEE